MNPVARQAAALLDTPVTSTFALSGGDLSELLGLCLEDGRRVVAKTGANAPIEADMLAALAASGAPAPAVLAASDDLLMMDWLPHDGRLERAWGSLGAAVRTLHAQHGPRYGWPCDFAFARVPIRNGWSDDWPAFWGARRLLDGIDAVPLPIARRLERLAADLPNRLPQRPPASLLHGDLWTGNVLVHADTVTGLIDPACYYGHGEVDVAMLQLFGAPTDAFFARYGALEPGHEERLAIYRLWPALVHLRLFGSGYRALVDDTLARVGV